MIEDYVLSVPNINYIQMRGWCGPTAMRVSLACQGKIYSQKRLARLIEADHNDGCDPNDFLRAAQGLGHRGYFRTNCALSDISECVQEGVPPIIGMHTPEGGDHWVTGLGFRNGLFFYADPQFGEVRKMHQGLFNERYWFGCYDLQPTCKNHIFEKGMIVIRK